MKLITLLLTISTILIAQQSFEYGKYNSILNPGFELGKSQWTATGGTFTVTQTAADVAFGKKSGVWDALGAGQKLKTNSYPVPKGLQGITCLARFYYKGGDANLTAKVIDGGENTVGSLVLSTKSSFEPVNIKFTCPTNTYYLAIESSADAAAIYIDQAYLGEDYLQTTPMAGNGLSYDPSNRYDVNTDNSTIEINTDTLRVKDLGVTESKIAAGAVTETKIGTNAVTESKIAENAVVSSKISLNTVCVNMPNNTDVNGDIVSLNITTSGGSVLFLLRSRLGATISPFYCDCLTSNTSYYCTVNLVRDSTYTAESGRYCDHAFDAFPFFDTPSPGSHTYTIRGFGTAGYSRLEAYSWEICAMEL